MPVLTSAMLYAACLPVPDAIAGGPRIDFLETSYDFGRVMEGLTLSHNFTFANAGNEVLEVLAVRSSCGCTTEDGWTRRVEPAKTGRIAVVFNSGGINGRITKQLSVISNDPQHSTVLLSISANAWKPLEIRPAIASFLLVGESQSDPVCTIRITNNMTAPLELSAPECSSTSFRAKLKSIVADKVFQLEITARPPLLGPYIRATTTLRTSFTNAPLITIPTIASVLPEIQVTPPRITLSENPVTFGQTITVLVRNHGNQPCVVSNATVNAKGIDTEVKEIQPGRYYAVSVPIPTGFSVERGKCVELALQTSHPKYRRLTVPIGLLPAWNTSTNPAPLRRPVPVPPAPAGQVKPRAGRDAFPRVALIPASRAQIRDAVERVPT